MHYCAVSNVYVCVADCCACWCRSVLSSVPYNKTRTTGLRWTSVQKHWNSVRVWIYSRCQSKTVTRARTACGDVMRSSVVVELIDDVTRLLKVTALTALQTRVVGRCCVSKLWYFFSFNVSMLQVLPQGLLAFISFRSTIYGSLWQPKCFENCTVHRHPHLICHDC